MTRTEGPIETAVLGAGRLARGIALVLNATGQPVRLWSRQEKKAKAIIKEASAMSKKGVHVGFADSLQNAVRDVDLVVLAVPANALLEVANAAAPALSGDQVLLHACRGLTPECFLPHASISKVCAPQKIAVLGGPLHLDDLAKGHPLAGVLATHFDEAFSLITRLVEKTPLRLQRSDDLAGVEVAGALSNVSAIAAGMTEALDLGDTARGVILTHGLDDAARVGAVLGAKSQTFSGLAGVGDMIPRRVSSTERHRHLGAALAAGQSLQDALKGIEGCIEGIESARIAAEMAKHRGLELGVVGAVLDVLEGGSAANAIEALLQKPIGLRALGR